MSVSVMAAVFQRYSTGGGEMLLALALADHASDDGSRIFPSIKALAEKTRQSERSVQYQLRRMEDSGWLIKVNHGNGGRNQTTEYRISPIWLKGADIAPIQKGAIDDVKGANGSTKGCKTEQERVQPVAPAYNHQEPSKNHQESGKRANALHKPNDVTEQTWIDFGEIRKANRAPLTATALERLRREAGKAGVSLEEALQTCCEAGWRGFRADWYANRQASQPRGQAPTETAYQRSQRLRVAEACPDLARPAPNETDFFRTAKPMGNVVEVQVREVERITR